MKVLTHFLFDQKKKYLVFLLMIVWYSNCWSQNLPITTEVQDELSNLTGIEKALALEKLCASSMDIDPGKCLHYAHQMLTLSEELQNDSLKQKAYNDIAEAYYNLQIFDSAFNNVNKAIVISNITGNEQILARSYYIISDINYYQGDHDKGIENCLKALDLYGQKDDSVNMARLYKEMAVHYREKGDYEMAIDYALKSLHFFEQKKDTLYMADALRVMSTIYRTPDLNIPKKRIDLLVKAKSLMKNHTGTSLFNIIMMQMGEHFSRQAKFDSAFTIYNEALTYVSQNNDSLRIANVNIAIGNNLMRMSLDSVKPALLAFRKAKKIYQALNLEKYICHTDFTFGELYYAIYQYDSSVFYLNKSLALSKQIGYSSIYKRSLQILVQVYEETSDFEKAYMYYRQFTQYSDSVSGEQVQIKIAELETKYETAKKEQDILELRHHQEIQQSEKKMLYTVLAGLVIGFVLILVFIWQKRKKDKEIHRQKELFHKKAQELSEAELEKRRIQEEELRQSVLYKSKQLSTHALHMMQKNTLLQEIQDDIKTLSKKVPANERMEYRRINHQINQSLRADNDWDVFKLYFEEVNRDFYAQLNKISPELTTNDHRLCALIKLNMNSKEMASVLNVAPNSIKSSRYRLKKKLGLDMEADLEEFIRSLS